MIGNIHQTSKWGMFQNIAKGKNWKWWIIGVFDDEKLIGGSLALKRLISFGLNWIYIPKGPVIDFKATNIEEILNAWLAEISKLAKQEQSVFVRIEPSLVKVGPINFGLKNEVNWKKFGFRKAHANYQPEHSIVLNIKQDENSLLNQMKTKGRYNIRLASKKGVKVIIAGEQHISIEQGVKEFYRILTETTSRDGFSGHPEQYYLDMLKTLGNEYCKLYLAEYDKKIIAGIIVTFYGDLSIYYFGASSNEYRNVMAPYLLQWGAILDAKKKNINWYDFLGTAPLDSNLNYDTKHEWAGVTEFKLKFGGDKVDYSESVEKIFNPFVFWLMKIKKGLKR